MVGRQQLGPPAVAVPMAGHGAWPRARSGTWRSVRAGTVRALRLGRVRVEYKADGARTVAFRLLRDVAAGGRHANLTLPGLIDDAELSGQQAALAAMLGYGTLRASGTLDEIIGCCCGRRPHTLGPEMLNLLRLGAFQLLRSPIPPHVAMSTTADLARRLTGDRRAITFVDSVLHQIATAGWDAWAARMSPGDPGLARISLRCAHPEWVAQAFSDALAPARGELELALRANDRWPATDLIAWPGRIRRDELAAESGGTPGRYSALAVRLGHDDPFRIDAVRERRAGLQGEASQLCTVAVTTAPISGRDERWLDLCAGSGGTSALLALMGAPRRAHVTAVEVREDRAIAARQATAGLQVDVVVGDARAVRPPAGGYDRVFVDAPGSALGALRRRPELRWTCHPDDIRRSAAVQAELLTSALRLVRPGGVVGYATSSPHRLETDEVVAGRDLIDARPRFPGVPDLGSGPIVRLWPHRHGTETRFFALIRG